MLINSTMSGLYMDPTCFSVLFIVLLIFFIIYILIIFVKPLVEGAGANVKTNPLSIITDNIKIGTILLAIYLAFSFYIEGFVGADFNLDGATKVEPTGRTSYCFEIDGVEETVSTETTKYHYGKVSNPTSDTKRVLLKQVHDSSTSRPYLEEVVCTYSRFPVEMKCNGFIFHSPEVE